MDKFKKRLRGLGLILGFFVGLGIFTYPLYRDALSQVYDQQLIKSYQRRIARQNDEEMKAYREKLKQENEKQKAEKVIPASQTEALAQGEAGDVSGLDLDFFEQHTLGILTIPSIAVTVPIYDTGTEAFLTKGAALLAGTSFPVGGTDTHSVIMAHRGLPEARLFTDLPDVEIGELFFIEVSGETLAYEVDQLKTVEPTNIEILLPVVGEDLVTLMTCTPYMVNSHRYLVRGHRVPYEASHKDLQDGISKQKMQKASLTFAGILLVALIGGTWVYKQQKTTPNKKSPILPKK